MHLKSGVDFALLAAMKALSRTAVLFLCLLTFQTFADTEWISTSSTAWTNSANWTNGIPDVSPPQVAYLVDSATIQHLAQFPPSLQQAAGISFGLFNGGAGFVLAGVTNSTLNMRAGGITNNDDNTQTINVPIAFFTVNGLPGGAETWVAAAGGLLFPGTNVGTAMTINNNGAMFTLAGSLNTSIGAPGGSGSIGGAGGLTKNGSGTLTLGGNAANTYRGGTFLNAGTIVAGKPNALNTNGLFLNGGTFQPNGYGQTNVGKMVLQGSSTIDLTLGATNFLSFTNSSAVAWTNGATLRILGWNSATNYLRVGTTASGLTANQLKAIVYPDIPAATATMSSTGYITPVVTTVPLTLSISNNAGSFYLTFQTQTNYTYYIDFEPALYPTNWMLLQSLPGTGGPATVTDTNPPDPARFYRARAQ